MSQSSAQPIQIIFNGRFASFPFASFPFYSNLSRWLWGVRAFYCTSSPSSLTMTLITFVVFYSTPWYPEYHHFKKVLPFSFVLGAPWPGLPNGLWLIWKSKLLCYCVLFHCRQKNASFKILTCRNSFSKLSRLCSSFFAFSESMKLSVKTYWYYTLLLIQNSNQVK